MRLLRTCSLVAASLAAPVAVAIGFASGCGGPSGGANTKTPASVTASSGSDDAGATLIAPPAPDTGTAPVDAGAASSSADAIAATDASDAPAAACWQGFTPTGNADVDLADLGKRCTVGMTQVFSPTKAPFKAGDVKAFPVPFPPGCYRIIAVGGTGVKDVDLELKDASGKVIAADRTPDDTFPMINPNKELCLDSLQLLTLSIIVKKGSGDVAGGVWKR